MAVAFLGSGAFKQLKLRSGDILVVNMGRNALVNHATDPREIELFKQAKVRVYSSPHLHAKVYVLGKSALVGSPNVSENSRDELVEAAILTTDRTIVSKARRFVEDQAFHEILPDDLTQAKALYDKSHPRHPHHVRSGVRESTWVFSFSPPGKLERRRLEDDQMGLTRKRPPGEGWRYLSYSVPHSDKIEVGDWIVEVTRRGRRSFVGEPSRVCDKGGVRPEADNSRRKVRTVLVRSRCRQRKPVPLSVFNRRARKRGIPVLGEGKEGKVGRFGDLIHREFNRS